MKKLFASIAFVFGLSVISSTEIQAQSATSANTEIAKAETTTSVRRETKMYRQPGNTSEVIRTLQESDEVVLVRKLNSTWSIVKINDEVGYVQNSRLRNIVK